MTATVWMLNGVVVLLLAVLVAVTDGAARDIAVVGWFACLAVWVGIGAWHLIGLWCERSRPRSAGFHAGYHLVDDSAPPVVRLDPTRPDDRPPVDPFTDTEGAWPAPVSDAFIEGLRRAGASDAVLDAVEARNAAIRRRYHDAMLRDLEGDQP